MRIGFGLSVDYTKGTSLSSYWTPQTLVVEDSSPTKIVMTGLKEDTTSVAADFTIAGFTVSSLEKDITSKILTLTLSIGIGNGISKSVVYKEKEYIITNNVTWSGFMAYKYTDVINTHTSFTSIQKAQILSRLQEQYIIDTFGPSGANKTTCDFFIYLWQATATATQIARTFTKTGATLR